MDVLDRSYAKKLFNALSSGYVSNTVTDNADGSKTLTINFVNGDKANITFTSVNGKGIKSITAEYYLSTSKTTQTGGSWVTTCPQWQANHYLWTRSKITYTDNTTEYTNASVDSSWEAVNDIQAGSRNLVKNSCFKDDLDNWNVREWGSYFTIDNNNTLNGHKSLKISTTGLTENKWIGVKQNLTTLPLRSGETYYISCWYYCEDKSTFDNGFALELKGRKEGATSDETIYNVTIASDKLIENKWTRISGKITLKDDWKNAYIYTWVEKNGVINVADIMVSKSDILTDWLPAPEDTQSQIDDVVQRVSTLQKQYDDTAIKNNISALQTGKVDKVSGKSLVDDTEIARLAKVDNYDDTALKTLIQTVANGLMASAGYSADYKSIEIISVGGTKKSIDLLPIISHAKVTDLSDVDGTDQADGKTLIYNSATGKHEYKTVEGTDEKVKMTSAGDSKYMEDLIDKDTIVNESGTLKAKTLDGLEASIAELNFIKGLQMPVQDLVNAFANGGLKTIDTPFATYADLQSYDVSTLLDDIRYLVRVLADETHDGKITAYLIKKDQTAPTFYGFLSDSRDFTTNPIDLVTEITGKLKAKNIDSDDLFALLTLSDVYKTATTKDEFFGTNGAKALYDELATAISKKANTTDLTTHTDDTDIHITSAERTKWNAVDKKVNKTDIVDNLTSTDTNKPLSAKQGKILNDNKVNKTSITTTINGSSTNSQIPSAKSVYDNAIKCNNIKTYYTLAQLGITTTPCTIKDIWDKMPLNSIAIIDTNSGEVTDLDVLEPAVGITANDQFVYGFLTVGKLGARTILEFRRSHSETFINPQTFIGYCIGKNCTSIQWKQMVLTNVIDKTWRELTLNSGVSGRVRYRVMNGICYVSIYALTSKTMSTTGQAITSGLPIPEITNNVWYNLGASANANLLVYIDSAGVLTNNAGLDNEVYYGTFSYPVKES